jgi:hypothetical protein
MKRVIMSTAFAAGIALAAGSAHAGNPGRFVGHIAEVHPGRDCVGVYILGTVDQLADGWYAVPLPLKTAQGVIVGSNVGHTIHFDVTAAAPVMCGIPDFSGDEVQVPTQILSNVSVP